MDVYHLFDCGTSGNKMEDIIPITGVTLVVAASPDKANYQQYLKSDPLKIFMEPWRFGEIVKVNNAQGIPVHSEELQKRYALVGGIPRSIFSVNTNIARDICITVLLTYGDDVRKVLWDIGAGLGLTEKTQRSHQVGQLAPRKGRRDRTAIPAGLFAAYYIRAIASLSDDTEFQSLFRTLGMVKDSGHFAGDKYKSYLRMVVREIGHNIVTMTGSTILSRHKLGCPNVWKDRMAYWSRSSRTYKTISELDGQLESAPHSYWKPAKPNLSAIDGLVLQVDEEDRLDEMEKFGSIQFIKVSTDQTGMNNEEEIMESLEEYIRRLFKGWSGNKFLVNIALWFVLPPTLYDQESGPWTNEIFERKVLEVSVDLEEKILLVPVHVGKVRFDWNTIREVPIERMVEWWWSQYKTQFASLRSEYESMLQTGI
eukprot:Plantae.Rhodophyta-Hildenbrandia_rubra.ctg439.p2 GENE.Plantae.Rhodophyta-Hildenbrandia_rubra.ctg439~~Plantae.Rhodophyta-Hildenbrandia_rubra.ctg439.p2  ORF type:complete len:425 (+),score=65.91 Plantae.Rhodophyta-Hildenbrandia_rubra.ctg439:868-2142(+)